MQKKGLLKMQIAILMLFAVVFNFNTFGQKELPAPRDGKLLRGEKWQKFIPVEKADFYVSPGGDDSWSGTLAEPNSARNDGPFATLQRAQKAVKALKTEVYFPKDEPIETRWIGSPHPLGKGRDILVYVREGFYELSAPLIFSPEDGGERVETNLPTGAFEYHKLKDHYVTYAAFPGEKPVISGGTKINSWKKSDNIWTTTVKNGDVKMLVVGGKTQVLARTPNEGYFTPPVVSETIDELPYRSGDLKNWDNMEDNRVIMLLRWHRGYNSFASIDEDKEIAYFKEPQKGVVIVPPRYYVENVKELMDSPGEWFFDKKTKELSYIPQSSSDEIAAISRLEELVVIKGEMGKPVRNLRIYGLTFEGALPGKSAISFEYAHACEIVGSELRSCGGTGIDVHRGCYQTQILDNRFEKIDNMVIHIQGENEPISGKDVLRETTVSYNRLYDCGGVNIYAINSLFTTISHNYITKTRGRYAIDVGRWNALEEAVEGSYLVEYNHLEDVQKDADDSGAIKTTGLTFNSVVRRNLIHGVNGGFFNDNVAFWFDNMSSQWISEENIYYDLDQGEMKLCAANLVDNIYRNNFKIETPANSPELIIEGDPDFKYSKLNIDIPGKTNSGAAITGNIVTVTANVENVGSTGISPVELYLDGKIVEKELFPVVHGNSRTVKFDIRVYDPGEHMLAIGTTPYKTFMVEGEKPDVVYEDLQISHSRFPVGETITVKGKAKNMLNSDQQYKARLYMDNILIDEKSIALEGSESKQLSFTVTPRPGEHTLRIENSALEQISVYEQKEVPINKKSLNTYCSATAKPYEIDMNPKKSRYRIKASGSDFFHAEDSYASVYLKKIKGDFVTTVKITGFGNRTHEWFRSGLFVRNDIAKSFDTEPGSSGSILMFGTPGRAGIHYDQFGDGCMHKASSNNIPEDIDVPIYLKLVRHGNSFTGYVSYDGETWALEKRTTEIPNLGESVDIGLAAGSCDKNQYEVEFSDWVVKVERQ
jgi:regulation of enolase protein 1 (concanavalin A-like superfamily)